VLSLRRLYHGLESDRTNKTSLECLMQLVYVGVFMGGHSKPLLAQIRAFLYAFKRFAQVFIPFPIDILLGASGCHRSTRSSFSFVRHGGYLCSAIDP